MQQHAPALASEGTNVRRGIARPNLVFEAFGQSTSGLQSRALSRLGQARSTARGFEPLRAEPNGFLVHHLSHSVTLSCCRAQPELSYLCYQVTLPSSPHLLAVGLSAACRGSWPCSFVEWAGGCGPLAAGGALPLPLPSLNCEVAAPPRRRTSSNLAI